MGPRSHCDLSDIVATNSTVVDMMSAMFAQAGLTRV